MTTLKGCTFLSPIIVKIPKLGKVRFKNRKENQNYKIQKVQHLTVIKEANGHYYVSLCCIVEERKVDRQAKHENQVVGLDFSPSKLYVDSDGRTGLDNDYKAFKQKSESKLHLLQKRMMKKKTGSNNRNKARIKVARLESHIANQRKDFLEKESLRLVKQYEIIGIEDLNLISIAKFLRNAKNINDCGWNMFTNMLERKAVRWNSIVIKADKYFPSSQICHVCGQKNEQVKNLKIREWTCPECHTHHNRDVNAAINLANNALSTLGSRGFQACGDNCHCLDYTNQTISVKQEVSSVKTNKNGNDL